MTFIGEGRLPGGKMPTPEVTVRPARKGEAGALAALADAAYGRTDQPAGWTSEEHLVAGPRIDEAGVRSLLQDRGSVVLVVERQGKLAACVHLEAGKDGVCELGLFAVDPAVQAEGIGGQLLTRAEVHAAEQLDADVMRLHVVSARTELLAWYERRGYTRTGEVVPFEPHGPQRSLQGPLSFEVLVKPLGSKGR